MNRIPDFSTIEPNIKFAIVSSSFRKIVRFLACQSGVILMYLMYAFKEVIERLLEVYLYNSHTQIRHCLNILSRII